MAIQTYFLQTRTNLLISELYKYIIYLLKILIHKKWFYKNINGFSYIKIVQKIIGLIILTVIKVDFHKKKMKFFY